MVNEVQTAVEEALAASSTTAARSMLELPKQQGGMDMYLIEERAAAAKCGTAQCDSLERKRRQESRCYPSMERATTLLSWKQWRHCDELELTLA